MNELKPCPHCLKSEVSVFESGICDGVWAVHCHGCGALSGTATSRQAAIDSWNNRPHEKALEDRNANLLEIHAELKRLRESAQRNTDQLLECVHKNRTLQTKLEKAEAELNEVHTIAAKAMAGVPRISSKDSERVQFAMMVFETINDIYHARKQQEKEAR